MTQYARPNADVSATNWTGSFEGINEVTPSDTDYIVGSNSANGTFICGLSSINEPATKTACTIKFRARKSAAAGNARQVSVQVFEGTTARGSSVASGDLTETWTEYTSSSIDLSAVTNWSTLRFNIVSAGTVSPPTGDKREVWVSWGELSTPDASGTSVSDNQPAFMTGQANATPASKAAFLAGQTNATPSSKSAYLSGTTPIFTAIQALGPRLHFPMLEETGTELLNFSPLGSAANGDYYGVLLAQTAGPDGYGLAPYFDGSNDYADFLTAAASGDIDLSTFSICAWFKVYDAATWTDATMRDVFRAGYNSSYYVTFIKQSTNNSLAGRYFPNGGTLSTTDYGGSTTWHFIVVTVDYSANELKWYIDGQQKWSTVTGFSEITGALAAAFIGAWNSISEFWKGYLCQFAMYQDILTSSEVQGIWDAAGLSSSSSSSKSAYLAGATSATPSSKAAYLSGQDSNTSNKPAFLTGSANATPSSKAAYLSGIAGETSSKAAYLEGYTPETTVGPNYPSTNTFDEAVSPYDDIGWTNHDNVISDNAVYATITSPSFDTGIISWRINANGFGFSIPSNAVILGIKVEVERRYAIATIKDALVALYNPSTAITSDNKADTVNNWPNTDTVKSYGGTADLWGIAWSPDAINSASFAVYFACVATGDNADAYVDFIRVSVTYKEGTNTSSSKVAYLSANANATPSSKAAYMTGGTGVTSSKAAYLAGQGAGTDVSSSKPAYLTAQGTTTSNKVAFLAGSTSATPSSKSAYLSGANGSTGYKPAYLEGEAAENQAYDNQSAYLKGQSTYTTSKSAYLTASGTLTAHKASYLFGILGSNSHKAAYLYGYMVGGIGKAFGYSAPTEGETAVSWQTFIDGSGDIPLVTGDTDWGKVSLPATGGEARSQVYDSSSTEYRTIILTKNRYGYGQGVVTLQIRGSATSFTQGASLPAWETYSLPITRNWRYIQVRVTNQ